MSEPVRGEVWRIEFDLELGREAHAEFSSLHALLREMLAGYGPRCQRAVLVKLPPENAAGGVATEAIGFRAGLDGGEGAS